MKAKRTSAEPASSAFRKQGEHAAAGSCGGCFQARTFRLLLAPCGSPAGRAAHACQVCLPVASGQWGQAPLTVSVNSCRRSCEHEAISRGCHEPQDCASNWQRVHQAGCLGGQMLRPMRPPPPGPPPAAPAGPARAWASSDPSPADHAADPERSCHPLAPHSLSPRAAETFLFRTIACKQPGRERFWAGCGGAYAMGDDKRTK